MFGFRRKQEATEQKEAEIQAIREETFKKIDKSNRSTKKLIDLLETKSVAENIFNATGGNKRSRK